MEARVPAARGVEGAPSAEQKAAEIVDHSGAGQHDRIELVVRVMRQAGALGRGAGAGEPSQEAAPE
jgi:hypothetical protein